jgi:hypothetical protein
MSSRQAPEPSESINVNQLRLDLLTLERRLRDGEEKVRQAKLDGDSWAVDRWEPAWIRLLQQYEVAYDRLAAALGEPPPALPTALSE